MSTRVLVVDKSPRAAGLIGEILGEHAQVSFATREVALKKLRAAAAAGTHFDIVLLDADPAPTAAMVRDMTAVGPRVILLAGGHDPIGAAVQCGASDVVARPIVPAELVFRVTRSAPNGDPAKRRPRKSDVLIGSGAWITEIYDRIAMVASTDVTVAIFGESGTGKELVARTIHNSSRRNNAPFVVVNCAAIPEQLLEDELFGHVRGAFTDASRDREGLLAAAHTGTLFLDEIGELPLPLQAKLLRVLQSHEFRRVGDDEDRQVDVRIVTATNRELDRLVARGMFRQDLYYRINVFPMQLPPLRDRPDDIALLAHHFIQKYRARLGKPIESLTPDALAQLRAYDFPGNVRELENKIHQAMVIASGTSIGPRDLALQPAPRTLNVDTDISRPFRDLKQEVIDAFERSYLTELLRAHRGNLAASARAAHMDRKNLWLLVTRHGLVPQQFKRG
jgi:DNA-binding NtrC family response regulator